MNDSNNSLSPFIFCTLQSSASSNSTSMFQGTSTASSLTSTNEWPPFNPGFQADSANNFFQEETPKEVKTELKKSIQVRKLANGEDMPEIEWKEPPPPQPKPPEKPEDIQLRREKNKIAAKKCREKKRSIREEYRKKIEKQEEIQSKLTKEVRNLRREYEQLKNIIQNHHCTLPGAPAINSLSGLQQFAQHTDYNANVLQPNVNYSFPPHLG